MALAMQCDHICHHLQDICSKNLHDFDLALKALYNEYKSTVNVKISIESTYMILYLKAITWFAIAVIISEMLANQIKCLKVDLEIKVKVK